MPRRSPDPWRERYLRGEIGLAEFERRIEDRLRYEREHEPAPEATVFARPPSRCQRWLPVLIGVIAVVLVATVGVVILVEIVFLAFAALGYLGRRASAPTTAVSHRLARSKGGE